MANNESIASFLELSQVLTGETRLSDALAADYYQRIQDVFGDVLDDLISKFDQLSKTESEITAAVESEIMSDQRLGTVAKEVIMIWYMAGFQLKDGTDEEGNPKFKQLGPNSPAQNFQALIWPTIHAHPLGLSGGYFGYWHYPPEN